jgi:Spy/CpxP family protein refolding chaperone
MKMTATAARAALVLLLATGAGCASMDRATPYAGQEARPIKALSAKETRDLIEGAGMGFAKAAELNRYPGPMHALELADGLELSPAQREALGALLGRHKAEARELGTRVVELERQLDSVFAAGTARADAVDAIVAELGAATARLRASHLKTHLEATRILTPAQVDRYVALRGYAGGHAH